MWSGSDPASNNDSVGPPTVRSSIEATLENEECHKEPWQSTVSFAAAALDDPRTIPIQTHGTVTICVTIFRLADEDPDKDYWSAETSLEWKTTETGPHSVPAEWSLSVDPTAGAITSVAKRRVSVTPVDGTERPHGGNADEISVTDETDADRGAIWSGVVPTSQNRITLIYDQPVRDGVRPVFTVSFTTPMTEYDWTEIKECLPRCSSHEVPKVVRKSETVKFTL